MFQRNDRSLPSLNSNSCIIFFITSIIESMTRTSSSSNLWFIYSSCKVNGVWNLKPRMHFWTPVTFCDRLVTFKLPLSQEISCSLTSMRMEDPMRAPDDESTSLHDFLPPSPTSNNMSHSDNLTLWRQNPSQLWIWIWRVWQTTTEMHQTYALCQWREFCDRFSNTAVPQSCASVTFNKSLFTRCLVINLIIYMHH